MIEKHTAPAHTDTGTPPLCSDPWQKYFILRRGILPCGYGHKPIAPMAEWQTAWNSDAMQEIRRSLAKGELPEYCRRSLSCPIVQRRLGEDAIRTLVIAPRRVPRPAVLRTVNRLLFRVPGRIYSRLKRHT